MIRRFAATTALAALIALPALAQQPQGQTPGPNPAQPPAPSIGTKQTPVSPAPVNPVAGQDPTKAIQGQGTSIPRQAQASADALVGRKVETYDGHKVGEIEDVVVDGTSGQIRSVIVKMAEAGPLTDKLVQMPFEGIRIHPSSTQVELAMDPTALRDLPQWSPDQLSQGTVAVRNQSGQKK